MDQRRWLPEQKAIFGVPIEGTQLNTIPNYMTIDWQLAELVSGAERCVFRVALEPMVPESWLGCAGKRQDPTPFNAHDPIQRAFNARKNWFGALTSIIDQITMLSIMSPAPR